MEKNIKVKALHNSPFFISLDPHHQIDKGVYGKVVKAFNKDNLCQQLVAKIISCKDQNTVESIKSQIQILKKIPNHQNLVNCVKIQLSSQNNFYLIMEYCNGGNLEKFMDKHKNVISEDKIKDFLAQFCAGYKILLQNGIIHRDIKPQNIMLHNNKFKIADFGLAKILDEQKQKDIHLSTKGTPLYMAPQLFFKHQGSSKVDVFSLGTVLYRLAFNGQYPFYDTKKFYGSAIGYANHLMSKKLIFPPNKRSKQLLRLIQRMLIKQKQKRISWQQIFNDPYIKNISGGKSGQKIHDCNSEESKILLVTNCSVIKTNEQDSLQLIISSKLNVQNVKLPSSLRKDNKLYNKLYVTKKYYSLIQYCCRKLLVYYNNSKDSNQFKNMIKKTIIFGLQFCLYKLAQLQQTSGNWNLLQSNIDEIQKIFNQDKQNLLGFLNKFQNSQTFQKNQYQQILYDFLTQYTSYHPQIRKQLAQTVRILINIYDFVIDIVQTEYQLQQNIEAYLQKIHKKNFDQIEKQIKQQLKKRGLLLA